MNDLGGMRPCSRCGAGNCPGCSPEQLAALGAWGAEMNELGFGPPCSKCGASNCSAAMHWFGSAEAELLERIRKHPGLEALHSALCTGAEWGDPVGEEACVLVERLIWGPEGWKPK